jgi:ribosomal protein L12E/L44/L45/RPP1/RPP2
LKNINKLLKMLAQADKKIVSLEKEVRQLKREQSTSGGSNPASHPVEVEDEKEMSRRRRLAKMQQQQQRRRKPSNASRAPSSSTSKTTTSGASSEKVTSSSISSFTHENHHLQGGVSSTMVDDDVLPDVAEQVASEVVKEEGRDSLSSFEDSDIEELLQSAPPVVVASSVASDKTSSSQELHAEKGTSKVPLADNTVQLHDGFADLDNEVDELVCEWAGGKSIIDMLITLPEIWEGGKLRSNAISHCIFFFFNLLSCFSL